MSKTILKIYQTRIFYFIVTFQFIHNTQTIKNARNTQRHATNRNKNVQYGSISTNIPIK